MVMVMIMMDKIGLDGLKTESLTYRSDAYAMTSYRHRTPCTLNLTILLDGLSCCSTAKARKALATFENRCLTLRKGLVLMPQAAAFPSWKSLSNLMILLVCYKAVQRKHKLLPR